MGGGYDIGVSMSDAISQTLKNQSPFTITDNSGGSGQPNWTFIILGGFGVLGVVAWLLFRR